MSQSIVNNDGGNTSGSPSNMNLNGPQGIWVIPDARILVSDTGNNRVLLIECPAWPG
jgi:hypothetical protein